VLPVNRRRRKSTRGGEPSAAAMALWAPEQREDYFHDKRLRTPLTEIPGVSVRTVNALERQGVLLAGELIGWSREDLLEVPNFGATTLAEVAKALATFGIKPPWKLPRRRRKKKPQRKE
jgi:DNA-directed RNA polymerase alpha subunit